MPVERAAGGTSLIDVLDRVLDKGIVIDAWVRRFYSWIRRKSSMSNPASRLVNRDRTHCSCS